MGFSLPDSKRKLLTTCFLILAGSCASIFAQTIQTVSSGDWNSPATWSGGIVPHYSNSTRILIMPGHQVTIPAGFAVSVDQANIRENGRVIVAAGGTLSVVEGSGNDLAIINNGGARGRLEVSGTFRLFQGATAIEYGAIYSNVLTSATFSMANGGTYIHNFANYGGSLLRPEWQDGSTLEIRGLTTSSSAPANLNQSFYNFVWNCPGQQKVINLAGNLTTVRGNLQIIGTNGVSKLYLMGSVNGRTMNVGGNFILSHAGSVIVSNGNNTFNVAGSILNSSTLMSTLCDVNTLNVNAGAIYVTSGHLRLAKSGTCNVNLSGNLSPTGLLSVESGGRANINMVGNVDLLGSNFSGYIFFNVQSGASLDLGTNYLGGTGGFNLLTGGFLYVGGSLQQSTSAGGLRVPLSSRAFQTGSAIVYNGTSAQIIGNGHPVSPGVDLVISNPTTVSMSNAMTVRSLLIQQGTFSPGSFTLNIHGNLTRAAGAIAAGTSTMAFGGSASQNITTSGSQLYNITVNKTGGAVTLTNAVGILGRLNILSAHNFNSNGFLTLLSTAAVPTNDGSIGPLTAGGTVVGNVNIQRYISAKGNINRYISSPITALPVSQLQDDFPVTGSFTGTSYPCTGCSNNGASLKWYDETKSNFAAGNRFVAFPTVSNAQTLVVGRGYAAYMWRNVSFTLDVTGVINSGNVNFPVTYNLSNPPMPDADGFNILGNPYPSAIAWNNGPGWVRNNISPTVYVNDAGTPREYNYLDQSGDLPNGIIAMGQGFYVMATGDDPSMSIGEVAKVDGKTGAFYRERPVVKSEQLIVSLEGNGIKANAFLKLNPEATKGFDYLFDAIKMPSDLLGISLLDEEGIDLVMHTVSTPEDLADVPVSIDVAEPGDYTFSFSQVEFEAAAEFFLLDRFTGESIPVTSGDTYAFKVSAASSMKDRFVLTRNPGAEQSLEEMVNVFPNPFDQTLTVQFGSKDEAQVEIIDLRGRIVIESALDNEVQFSTQDLGAGVYLAKVKTPRGVVVRKIIKQ